MHIVTLFMVHLLVSVETNVGKKSWRCFIRNVNIYMATYYHSDNTALVPPFSGVCLRIIEHVAALIVPLQLTCEIE